MFFLKRAWYYVTRKLGKVITIGIILFIVSSLVLTGLVINSASESAATAARKKLGANVTYSTELRMNMQTSDDGPARGSGGSFNFEIPEGYSQITTKEIETIVNNSKYVKNYSIFASMSATASDFSYYDPFNSSSPTSNKTITNGMYGGSMRIDSSNINIMGLDTKTNNNIFDLDTLIDGRYFTDEEIKNNEMVIVIEETIATMNGIGIGDIITMTKSNNRMTMVRPGEEINTEEDTIEMEFTVVGIYKTNSPTNVAENQFRNSANLSENLMYAPYTTILLSDTFGLEGNELSEKLADIEENGYAISSVIFTLKNPEDIDAFIEEVKNMEEIDMTYRLLDADTTSYETMVGPIQNVASTSKILVIVVIIAGAFIIGLLSMLSIKDRKYELGVLLSLGESRVKIISQLIVEMLIVAVFSFTLASLTANTLAQGVTNYLLNKELESQNAERETTQNNPTIIRGGLGNMIQRSDISTVDVETIEELTVNINISDMFTMFGIGIIIIVLGNSIQTLFVLKANPKEILLER